MAGEMSSSVWVWWGLMVLVLITTPTSQNDLVSRLFQDISALKFTLLTAPLSLPFWLPPLQQRSGGAANEMSRRSCFGELGCLDTSSDFLHPKHRPYNMEPNTREQIRVQFNVSSREDPRGVIVPGLDVPQVLRSSFKSDRQTKFIIHGFLNGRDMPWLVDIADAYLRVQDLNVVYVEWTGGSIALYSQAVANARVVGLEVAHFINWLKDHMGLHPRDVHLIGHSLGAHVTGYAGERVADLGRITGLDPAEPFFQFMPPTVRLDPTDAIFVDVIHTDTEPFFLAGGYGMRQAVGHLDFYPNGGERQPGCDQSSTPPLLSLLSQSDGSAGWRDVENNLGCNHVRAVTLFIDSILGSCPYVAFRCSSYSQYRTGKCFTCETDGSGCASMGDEANTWPGRWPGRPHQTGVQLFLTTGAPSSYCRYHYKLRVKVGEAGCGGTGYLNLTFVSSDYKGKFDLTRSISKKFVAGKAHTFFLEYKHDLSSSEAALVTWSQQKADSPSCRSPRHAALPLTELTLTNLEMSVYRQRRGRSEGRTPKVTLCPEGPDGVTWVGSGETVRMSAAPACTTTTSSSLVGAPPSTSSLF